MSSAPAIVLVAAVAAAAFGLVFRRDSRDPLPTKLVAVLLVMAGAVAMVAGAGVPGTVLLVTGCALATPGRCRPGRR